MAVVDGLLAGDPAVRWQVLRDLAEAPADEVAAERARVATHGWGARLLENTHPGAVYFALDDGNGRPSRWNTLRALRVLRCADDRSMTAG